MSLHNKTAGQIGEGKAAQFLERKGYHLLTRNFRARNGEIDLIFLTPDKKEVVFVEVKTRLTTEFGNPLEAITYYKMKALMRTAQLYVAIHKNLPEALRIDAISIVLDEFYEINSLDHIISITS
jgi:putative endonuclease